MGEWCPFGPFLGYGLPYKRLTPETKKGYPCYKLVTGPPRFWGSGHEACVKLLPWVYSVYRGVCVFPKVLNAPKARFLILVNLDPYILTPKPEILLAEVSLFEDPCREAKLVWGV